jgi:hypothetical protein
MDGGCVYHTLDDVNVISWNSIIFPRSLADLLNDRVAVPCPIFSEGTLRREEGVKGLYG